MAAEWQSIRLGELSEVITKGTTPTTLGYRFTNSGINYVKSESVTFDGWIDRSKFAFIEPETHEALKRSQLQEGDILFSMAGVFIGKTAVVPKSILPANTNQAVGIVRLDKRRAEPRFIDYFLRNPSYNLYLNNLVAQSAQPNLNLTEIRNLPINLPPLAEQKRIAEVLGALDDKIELNRRMNATLEATARALFQSWFVDFYPIRAKLDGRTPLGMDTATATLFPDSFEESPLGHIPKGWEVKPVGEVVDCVGGGTPSTSDPKYWEGGTYHWTTPKDFSSLQAPILLDTERRLTDAGVAKISSGLLPAGTLLMSSRAPVGYLAISAIPVAINQGFIAMKCNEQASNYFMLNWCQQNMAEIEGRATGTTFAEISKQNFRPIPLVLPKQDIMTAFSNRVAPLYEQITANLRQSRTLAILRDTLLPKLLFGELSVREAASLT
jgi:type I restriction enzyme S subunit